MRQQNIGNKEQENISAVNQTQRKQILIPFQLDYGTKNQQLPQNSNIRIDKNIGMQMRVVIIVTSSIFFLGFNRALIAAIVNSQTTKQFQNLFNFQGSAVSIKAALSAMSPMGAFFGTIFCSILIKTYSSREILKNACMFAIIFTITTMYTQIIILMIFRFGIGWCVGTFVAVVPSYIKQITSKNVAPYFGTAPVINESLGGLLSFILAFAIYEACGKVRETWIIMCALNIIPLIVIIICIQMNIIYQSPVYYLKNSQQTEAREIFAKIYQPQFVNSIVKQKQLEIHRFYFNQIKLLFLRNKNQFMQRKDILIGVHLPILRKMTGILVILLSSGSMLKSIHPEFQRKAPILISLVYFISCFLSNVVLKLMTRRGAFQLGTISICICNLVLALSYAFEVYAVVILVFKVILLIMYGLTFGPLVWSYLPEVVPARIIPLAQSMNWFIDCFTLSLPGVIIAHHGNPWPLFFVFFLWDFASIFVNHFLIVQTKRKSISQIIQKLN